MNVNHNQEVTVNHSLVAIESRVNSDKRVSEVIYPSLIRNMRSSEFLPEHAKRSAEASAKTIMGFGLSFRLCLYPDIKGFHW